MKILVVDEEPMIRDYIEYALKTLIPDVTVTHAINRDSALTVLQKEPKVHFDGVVVGASSSTLSGITIVRCARITNPEARIVFLSAVMDSDLIQLGTEAGANECLPKPFNIHELATALTEQTASFAA